MLILAKSELPPDITDNESVFSDADDSIIDSVVSNSTVNSIPPKQSTTTTTTTPLAQVVTEPTPQSPPPPKDETESDDSHDQADHVKGILIHFRCL